MEKFVGVVELVDVRRYMVCMLYVMYVSVENFQESVVPWELSMRKLVSVVKHVDVREFVVRTLCVMYVSV